jgi:hypothetical protein
MAVEFDLQLWEAVARNHRFQAWLNTETAKYTVAIIRMTDSEQLRVLQGRLQELDDIRKSCEAATKT